MATLVVILVVEDEESIRWMLDEALSDGGYTVMLAKTAEEAIAMIDDTATDCRALLTDVNLTPDKLTGWDVARHAREVREGIPVIYMTGGSAHEWSVHGVPNSLLLTKPFAPAQAVTAVSQLLNSLTSPPADP